MEVQEGRASHHHHHHQQQVTIFYGGRVCVCDATEIRVYVINSYPHIISILCMNIGVRTTEIGFQTWNDSFLYVSATSSSHDGLCYNLFSSDLLHRVDREYK